jgi:regulator of replication initiation timing
MEINNRLEREIEDMRRAQAKSDVEAALLRQENAVLKERIHELEQRLANYERGHGA